MSIEQIDTGTNANDKQQAVFIMLYAETDIWRNYQEISETARTRIVPVVLMLQRWDGKIGFVGGNVEKGEDLLVAALREFKEETGFDIKNEHLENINLLCSHETDKLVTHLMGFRVTESVLRDVLINNHKAEHFMSEGTLFTTQMINYSHTNTFDNFMQNNFAITVKEEIAVVIDKLKWKEKYNLTTSFLDVEKINSPKKYKQ